MSNHLFVLDMEAAQTCCENVVTGQDHRLSIHFVDVVAAIELLAFVFGCGVMYSRSVLLVSQALMLQSDLVPLSLLSV